MVIALIKKQFKSIIQHPLKIFNIIKGFINFKIKNKVNYKRLYICDRCEYKINVGGQSFCDICGCMINLKTSVPQEHCPKNKW